MKWLEYYDKPDNKISEDFQPSIPKVSEEEYNTIVIPSLIKWGAIPKSKLIIGKTYKGYCRNASEAIWLGDKFEYQRYKFYEIFPERINHFEDDNGYDLFVPYKELENG
jgi:hypothetical protein